MISCCTWALSNKPLLELPSKLFPSWWRFVELIGPLILSFYLSCPKHAYVSIFMLQLDHKLEPLELYFKMLTLKVNTHKHTQYYNIQLSKWMTPVVTDSTSLIKGLVMFELCRHVWMNLLAWRWKMMEHLTPYTTIKAIQL
jgi:hypothetical protein